MRIFSRLSNWYFSKGALPYWGVLFLDCLIALFSGYVGSYLEHGGLEFAQHFWQLTAGNIVCTLLFAVAFRMFHTYSGILRFSSLVDLERVGLASFVAVCLSYIVGIAQNALGGGKLHHNALAVWLRSDVCMRFDASLGGAYVCTCLV